MTRTVRIATRASALALWQARFVGEQLVAHDPAVEIELVELSTSGDERQDVPIAVIGGKGVFVKEVQSAVLDGRADLAVHSAKDLPAVTPDGLVIAAVPERGDPRDVLIGASLEALATTDDAVVATGSARRRVQVQHRVALAGGAVSFAELRGRIETRLEKRHGFTAIVMAAAALQRLGLNVADTHVLSVEEMIPQVGQGTLAVECAADNEELRSLLGAAVDHPDSARVLDAERSFLQELGGDCDLPAGAHATLTDIGDTIHITGMLSDMDGANFVQHTMTGSDGPALGRDLARLLVAARSVA